MNKLILAAAAAVIAAPALAQDEQAMTMDQVPAAVMEAAQARAEGVEFTEASMDDDEGTMTYELSGEGANGMMVEIDVLEDGTIEEYEEEIAMEGVPEAVSATLEENLAGFEPTMIERSTRPDKVVYEFEGTHDGKEVDIEIDEDGSNYMMNDDMAG